MKTGIRLLCLLASMTLLLACSGASDSPETQIRRLIERGVEAAENRSTDDLTELLHPQYVDQQGNNQQRVATLLRAYFIRHRNIHLFTRLADIEFPAADRAVVTMHVAMAGSRIADMSVLASLRAQIYRFELHLVKYGEWRVRQASWQRASLSDLE